MFIEVSILFISIGGIQYMNESNDQVAHYKIIHFVHYTLFSVKQSSMCENLL